MTNEEAISRQAVLEQIDYWAIGNREYLPTNAMDYLTERMQDLPSVTSQPKMGRWIKCDVLQEVKCSECRKCFGHKTKYCPNCGAKMVESEGAE